ncbi:MAG: aminotransferase class V-fold PLP-dependent enzyme [Cyclobacteriaceae bacterium]|nr:aminotransferase class V-fold PLP-dependent enzyme [Cyclobacteriaceae bacterium]
MQNQRAKFSIPKGNTYLNCAYMSPLLKSVEKAGKMGIERKRNPFAISADDFFSGSEPLRKEYAKLINVKDPKRIVIIPSVSYGLATVAKNTRLQAGDKIIVAAEQFPSNYYPWQRLSMETKAVIQAITPPDQLTSRGKVWNERILEAIDSKTRIVALGHVHWADGTRFDLERIRKRTRDVGALLIIDGTQSVGALPFDVQKIQPDALVCGGYKWLMGPYSMGLAYYGEHFDNGQPIEENWINRRESENFAALVNYKSDYQPGALRYEVGEHSNFILVPMMLEALKQINQWKPENIQTYCNKISKSAIKDLRQRGYWIEEEDSRGHHLFGVRFPGNISIDQVKEKVKARKISVSFRGDSMRVAPNVYNEAKDFDRLLDALK